MILVWMGHGNFGACEPMTHQLYQADIRPYAWPLADPDQPVFIFPHIQQQPQDVQQLINMYAAVQDPQVAPPLTMSRKR